MTEKNAGREGLLIGIGVSIFIHLGLIAGLIILDYAGEQTLKRRVVKNDCQPSFVIVVPLQEKTNINTEMEI